MRILVDFRRYLAARKLKQYRLRLVKPAPIPRQKRQGFSRLILTDDNIIAFPPSCYRPVRIFGTATVHRSLGGLADLWQSEFAMTITYANGTMVEGIALVCTDGFMRVALRGCRDSVEFVAGAEGTWLDESGEPVLIGHDTPRPVKADALEDFICSQEVLDRVLGRAGAELCCAIA